MGSVDPVLVVLDRKLAASATGAMAFFVVLNCVVHRVEKPVVAIGLENQAGRAVLRRASVDNWLVEVTLAAVICV